MDLESLNSTSLSQILGLAEIELITITQKAPKLYFSKPIPKKDGKTRILEIPHKKIRLIQSIILEKILNLIQIHPILYGGPGSSTKKAASPHIKKPLLITADIKNFFPSIKAFQIRNAFLLHGASHEVAKILTRLVTHANHLPQGAPTSPAIARLVLKPFADELEGLFKKIQMASASIYVDDIILSGPKGIRRFLPVIRKMMVRQGFILNKKTKLMYKNEEQVCLNIRVNNGIAPPSSFMNKMNEFAKLVLKTDPRLKGMKSWARFLNKE